MRPSPAIFSKTTNVAAYYIMAAAFYCIIWFVASFLPSDAQAVADPTLRRRMARSAHLTSTAICQFVS
jgi:type IV secretory pathway TrbD component